ncbi:MAG TPA: response regulator [Candidatus Altiarchaeales archaeon]|nr:response regulator [Candidatus Altiarchaeales archaeon]
MTKILIADDSAFMRKILKNILSKARYTDIVEAEDGEDAVRKFTEVKPDLVLLDIIMEKKYGTDALKDILG